MLTTRMNSADEVPDFRKLQSSDEVLAEFIYSLARANCVVSAARATKRRWQWRRQTPASGAGPPEAKAVAGGRTTTTSCGLSRSLCAFAQHRYQLPDCCKPAQLLHEGSGRRGAAEPLPRLLPVRKRQNRVRPQRREGRDRDLDPVPLSHSHHGV